MTQNQTNLVEKTNTNAVVTPMYLLKMALDTGADIEKLQQLLDLQKEYESNEARKAYSVAFAEFKKNPPEINKDVTVSYPNKNGDVTTYKHSSLSNVVEKIGASLGQQGLSHSWNTEQNDNGQVVVTCKLTHALGHSEETTLKSSPDASGGKNNIQAIGSVVTYLERYTLLAVTGLATKGQDDDGRGLESEQPEDTTPLTTDHKASIQKLLSSTKSDIAQFLLYMNAKSIDEIKDNQYNTAMVALAAKQAQQSEKQG